MKCARVCSGLSTVLVPDEVGSLHFSELATRGQWGLGLQGHARLEPRAVQESIFFVYPGSCVQS